MLEFIYLRMIQQIYFVSLVTIFSVGCSSTETSDQQKETNTEDSLAEENFDTIEEFIEPEPVDFPIERMPSVWYRLLCEDEDLDKCVIYDYCEAEHPQIWIEEKELSWQLTALYGQDSDTWTIEEFSAVEEMIDGRMFVNGKMKLASTYDKSDKRTIDFSWDLAEYRCRFEGFLHWDENYFVSEEDSGNYEEVVEDCTGLWE